jgi:HK97 family phage prohead protease
MNNEHNAIKIAGYAVIFNQKDLHNDIIIPGAIEYFDGIKNVKLLWQHDHKTIIGEIESAVETTLGLYFIAKIYNEISYMKDINYMLKNKVVNGVSIGFTIKKSRNCDQKKVRLLEKINIHEISIVTFGAQPNAKIIDIIPRRDY